MTDVSEEQKVSVPVMKPLPELNTRTMKCVDERSFHEARFIDCTARMIIRARRPLDHPVKDFELAKLCLPRRNTFGAEIIHEGLLAGSRAHRKQRTQVFIEQIPFLLEAIESALRFFFDGLLYGEEVFVSEFLGGHIFLTKGE